MTDVTLGHKINFSIVYLDQNGNPMLTTPTVDKPPAWSNTTPTTETLTVSPDGLTATANTLAVGTDVVNLSVQVGGAPFSATIGVNVTAIPQVLTSIQINAVVN